VKKRAALRTSVFAEQMAQRTATTALKAMARVGPKARASVQKRGAPREPEKGKTS
jgi:hypothetical protein